MDEFTRNKILESIEAKGYVDSDPIETFQRNGVLIGNRENNMQIVDSSSGFTKIKTNLRKRFNMIFRQPEELSSLNNSEIRCALCNNVISYPCWFFKVEYRVNKFYFFVCYDTNSPEVVTAECAPVLRTAKG